VEIVRARDGEASEGYGALVRELPAEPGAAMMLEWTARGRRWPERAESRLGEVVIYVARGALEVDLGGTIHALDEGDAMRFDGTIPHRLRRRGGPGTRALILATG
jgi:quercetin dioxygenase-like cupin family protein